MGFNGGVKIQGHKAIATLNNFMYKMDLMDPDIIIVGSQSGTAPDANYHLDYFNLAQYEFLLGTQPDAVVLCVSGYQYNESIIRSVQFIQSATRAVVIALVLFPLIRKMEVVSNLRRFRPLEKSEREQICARFSNDTALPCYDLASTEDIDILFSQIIDYYA